MNKKIVLIIVLVITLIITMVIILLSIKPRYNKLVINENDWNNIIETRKESKTIEIDNIKFNDYNLSIDKDKNIIYYSIVNVVKKYNPLIDYITNTKTKLVINKNITDDLINNYSDIKIMIYNDKYYRIYSLYVTDLPVLNIKYIDKEKNNKISLTLFDNHIDRINRIIKSDGKLKEEENGYTLVLKKESLGHNRRDNDISIFGGEKNNEYILRKEDTKNIRERNILLFIDDEYKGIYTLNHKNERRMLDE